jgi:cation transport ATPase
MWGDLLIITPLLYAVIHDYSNSWSVTHILAASVAGVTGSYFMHKTYKAAKHPEAHVMDKQLTVAGYLHMVYMAVALAIIILFYIFSNNVGLELLWSSTALLILHVIIGTHIPLKVISPWWFYKTPILDMETLHVVAGSAALLITRSWFISH